MIIITGGAGFIGSNLAATLSEKGERVCVSDWLGSDDKWRNLSRHDIDEIVSPPALDELLSRRRAEIEFVFHLGAVSSTTETDVDRIIESNLSLSQKVWRWCARHGVPLVYASSAATYGAGEHGFADTDDRESLARLRPLNPYGWSKHAFDRWVAREVEEGRDRPPRWAGMKFFNVYGPNEYHKGDMRSAVTRAWAGAVAGHPATLFRSHHPDYADGGQLRDFVYVADCVDVMTWLRDHRVPDGLYNVGTGRSQSWLEVMEALYSAVGRPLEIDWVDTPTEIRDRYQYFTRADIGKLRRAGYEKAFASVEAGVADYVTRFLTRDDPYR